MLYVRREREGQARLFPREPNVAEGYAHVDGVQAAHDRLYGGIQLFPVGINTSFSRMKYQGWLFLAEGASLAASRRGSLPCDISERAFLLSNH